MLVSLLGFEILDERQIATSSFGDGYCFFERVQRLLQGDAEPLGRPLLKKNKNFP